VTRYKRPLNTVQLWRCDHHGLSCEQRCKDCTPLPRLPTIYSFGNDKDNFRRTR
jgi:hypothetical protein